VVERKEDIAHGWFPAFAFFFNFCVIPALRAPGLSGNAKKRDGEAAGSGSQVNKVNNRASSLSPPKKKEEVRNSGALNASTGQIEYCGFVTVLWWTSNFLC
jgi:hypothetical protein